MKVFECKGCSVIIFISKNEKEPLWCPLCRLSMTNIEIEPKGELEKYVCPECNYKFLISKEIIPYKCPNCNYTFVKTEGKVQEERL